MLSGLKAFASRVVPKSLHIPAYYGYAWLRGFHEPEMKLLPFLIRRGEQAVDVGGNRGTYAYRLQRLGARVAVFEPNPVYYRPLRHWADSGSAVAVHAVALSSEEGEAVLNIPVDAAGVEHGSAASIETRALDRSRAEVVSARTLDSFRIADVSFIKIDVEGHEHAVIGGATGTLGTAKPAILIEIEQRHLKRPIAEVFNSIAVFGYQGFFLSGGRLQPLATFDPGLHQNLSDPGKPYVNNFLFLHAESLGSGRYGGLRERWM